MTERKPPGTSWETWIDAQIRVAREQGAFDNLPGAGKPLPFLGQAHDPLWWVKQLAQREQISILPILPPSLELGELLHVLAAHAGRGLVEQHGLRAKAIGQRDREKTLHAIGNLGRAQVVIGRADTERFQQCCGRCFGALAGLRLAPRHEDRGDQSRRVLGEDGGYRILQHRQLAEEAVLLEGAP